MRKYAPNNLWRIQTGGFRFRLAIAVGSSACSRGVRLRLSDPIRFTFPILVMALTLACGCIMPRIPHALAPAQSPAETTYLMPARVANDLVSSVSTNVLVRDLNVVLEGMVTHNNHLIGPKRTSQLSKDFWPARDIDLGSQEVMAALTTDQTERLSHWARTSGCRRIILSKAAVSRTDRYDSWLRQIDLEMWLWQLDPPRELAHSRVWKQNWTTYEGGAYGAPALMVYGTTFAYAMDQAVRAALIDLFKQERQNRDDTPKH